LELSVKDCGCEPFTIVSKDAERFRVCQERASKIGKLTTPMALYNFVAPDVVKLTHEEFYVIGLGAHGEFEGKVITYARVASGGQHKVEVEVERIAQVLLADRPDVYILCHNHPSNDAAPSDEDGHLTEVLREGLAKACPKIIYGDHLIVCEKEFYSFREGKKTKVK
jgi:DNA repair protein RadC